MRVWIIWTYPCQAYSAEIVKVVDSKEKADALQKVDEWIEEREVE